jgi:hypothetical protein
LRIVVWSLGERFLPAKEEEYLAPPTIGEVWAMLPRRILKSESCFTYVVFTNRLNVILGSSVSKTVLFPPLRSLLMFEASTVVEP